MNSTKILFGRRIIITIIINALFYNAHAVEISKDSSNKFINKLSINFVVIPNYISSFNNNITLYTRDHTKNLGQGIRFGATAEYKFTKRSAFRLGIYHYNESSNFEMIQYNNHAGFQPDSCYFVRNKQTGIEFPIEYKFIFINKRIKVYFVAGLILSYFYKQSVIIFNNGIPNKWFQNDTVETTNQFQKSVFTRPVIMLGINYSISKKVNVLIEPAFFYFTQYMRFGDNFIKNYSALTLGINYNLLSKRAFVNI